MKLWLVRHAQPLVESGVCYGSTDIPADAQATATQARQLAELLPAGVRIFSSPLQRCESLALMLCGLRPDLVYERDARLRELDFGRWEGRRWCDIRQDEFDTWMDDFAEYHVGGGESVQALMGRVGRALRNTRECVAFSGQAAKGNAVWITHAGVICAATLLAKGITDLRRPGEWPTEALGYGQWCELALFGAVTSDDIHDRGLESSALTRPASPGR